jgi:Mn2+/Fe2+ NRAMP family transporter
MKKLSSVALGILTSVGGYLEAGSLGTALQAGSTFRFSLLWATALGTICIAFLCEMTGRLAAVSHHTVVGAMRERFGIAFQVWPLGAQAIVDLLTLASEIGGASLALQLATGISMRLWVVPVMLLLWALLWFATFGVIENGVAVLGLVTLSFVAAAWWLGPDWHEVGRGLLPHVPAAARAKYAYLAVAVLGATISPYMVTFYSSGAVEEKWTVGHLGPNRAIASIGMTFGSIVSMSVAIVAGIVLAPRGIVVQKFEQAAGVLSAVFPRSGFALFCASLAIGCIGAALELSLDLSYIVAQSFGWNWGENQRPAEEARFALVYTGALLVASVPSIAGVDPLSLTLLSMVLTALVLPIVVGPLVVLMNDTRYLKTRTNGVVTNCAVVAIVLVGFVLAVVALPLQIMGGG